MTLGRTWVDIQHLPCLLANLFYFSYVLYASVLTRLQLSLQT